jgi:hypothetical protein
MLPPEEGVLVSEKGAERFGKCPVEAQLTREAITRTFASEVLCEDEYGVGVGDPSLGWWSNNWVNSPAMGPGPGADGGTGLDGGTGAAPVREDQESAPHPSK